VLLYTSNKLVPLLVLRLVLIAVLLLLLAVLRLAFVLELPLLSSSPTMKVSPTIITPIPSLSFVCQSFCESAVYAECTKVVSSNSGPLWNSTSNFRASPSSS
jgi:hypothetical protein